VSRYPSDPGLPLGASALLEEIGSRLTLVLLVLALVLLVALVIRGLRWARRAGGIALAGHGRVAVISGEAGAGVTTTTAMLGQALDARRDHWVVALDPRGEQGSLRLRVQSAPEASPRSARLGILTVIGVSRPAGVWERERLRQVVALLETTYDLVVMDIGAAGLSSAGPTLLPLADQVVLVTSGRHGTLKDAARTLDWLERSGHGRLARGTLLVVNSALRGELAGTRQALRCRCRAVLGIRRERRLAAGGEAALDRLESGARGDYLELARAVQDGLSPLRRPSLSGRRRPYTRPWARRR